jgi:3alpha(or 20beta)-hydroxysteroid dehydrogenase
MGAAHVRLLSENGARVLCCDVLAAEGAALAQELGSMVRFLPLDVTSREQWREAVATAERFFGPVSILVNNAGVLAIDPIESMTEEAYRRVIDVNQVGTFLGMQAVIPSMRRAAGGSIVNISSTAGFAGAKHMVAYVASKFAVRGMTKVAALELGPDKIRVNSVHPGGVATPMVKNFGAPAHIPIPRLADPSELAQLVLFLASDASSYCTGSEFVADGGYLAVVGEDTSD